MDVSVPDLCSRRPDAARRVERLALPLLRLVHLGCEPVTMRWHRMRMVSDFWRFYVVDRPGLALVGSGARMPYPVDGITVIPGYCPFTFFADARVGHAFIHCAIPAWPEALVRRAFPEPFVLDHPDSARRLQDLGRAISGQRDEDATLAWRAQALSTDLMWRILARLDDAMRQRLLGTPAGRLAPALALVEERMGTALSVADLAATIGVGAARCSRLFQAELGQSPVQYLLGRRVARTAELLVASGLGMEEIATRCGFPDRHYLTRQFSRRMGIPPARYRAIYQT